MRLIILVTVIVYFFVHWGLIELMVFGRAVLLARFLNCEEMNRTSSAKASVFTIILRTPMHTNKRINYHHVFIKTAELIG